MLQTHHIEYVLCTYTCTRSFEVGDDNSLILNGLRTGVLDRFLYEKSQKEAKKSQEEEEEEEEA